MRCLTARGLLQLLADFPDADVGASRPAALSFFPVLGTISAAGPASADYGHSCIVNHNATSDIAISATPMSLSVILMPRSPLRPTARLGA
jgi:hypothetical protein